MKSIEYYKNHPVEYIEEIIGVKLHYHQKVMIESFFRGDGRVFVAYGRMNGRRTLHYAVKSYMDNECATV